MSSHIGLGNMLRQTVNDLKKKQSIIALSKGKVFYEASTL